MHHQNDAKIVFREKEKFLDKTYSQVYKEAISFATALKAYGINEGDFIAIHGSNSYYWMIADFACILLGSISVALYPTASRSRMQSAIADMSIPILISDDNQYLNTCKERTACKVISLLPKETVRGIPTVKSLISQYAGTTNFEICSTSRDIFTIVSTSGTLSEPNFFAVHAESLLYTMDRFTAIYNLTSNDSLLMVLPQSHLPQRMITYGMLKNQSDIMISGPDSFIKDTLKFCPTIQVVVPRLLQFVDAQLAKKISSAHKSIIAKSHFWDSDLILKDDRLRKLLYDWLCAPLLGSSTRYVFVGSAPMPKKLLERLVKLGLPIFEIYGTTEVGILAMNTPNHIRLGTVGKPADWITLELDETTSEVCISTEKPFIYNYISQEGNIPIQDRKSTLFHTGDIGKVEDGYLTLLGRTKDYITLANGENIFVRKMEEYMLEIDGIEECVVIGNGKKSLSAVFFLKDGVAASVTESIREFIRSMNDSSHKWEKIMSFEVAQEKPSVENEFLTETFKIRRHAIDIYYSEAGRKKVSVN